MVIIDPQQELFTEILIECKKHFGANNVFDGAMPSNTTPYPFVYIGDSQLVDNTLKDIVIGNVHQIIHVWSNNPLKRGDVSKMLLDIKNICRKISKTSNLIWVVKHVNQRILPDNTTKAPLLHGVLEVEFAFY